MTVAEGDYAKPTRGEPLIGLMPACAKDQTLWATQLRDKFAEWLGKDRRYVQYLGAEDRDGHMISDVSKFGEWDEGSWSHDGHTLSGGDSEITHESEAATLGSYTDKDGSQVNVTEAKSSTYGYFKARHHVYRVTPALQELQDQCFGSWREHIRSFLAHLLHANVTAVPRSSRSDASAD